MVTWDYRVFREAEGDYVIREVFYDDQSQIIGCTENAVEPKGDSLALLMQDLTAMQAALELPILTLADIPPSVINQRPRQQTLSHDALMAQLGLNATPRFLSP